MDDIITLYKLRRHSSNNKNKTITKNKPIAKKRQNYNTEEKNKYKLVLTKNIKPITIYAYLCNENTGKFYNKQDDYFYNILESIKEQHIDFLNYSDNNEYYKKPYNNKGFFKFKSTKQILLCYDINKNIVNWDECLNQKALFTLRIKPYDFICDKENRRIVGISIQVMKIEII